MRVWTYTAAHPACGISHARIAGTLTRQNWLQKAVVRQGPTSIYYTYILYAGARPEEGPWKVEVHGNDVNWEYFPRTDDFSQEFADLDDALRYANGEDDSYFAQTTVPAKRSYWPWERPPESHTIIEFNRPLPTLAAGPAVSCRRERRLQFSRLICLTQAPCFSFPPGS